jgi:CheY-like chemotaxis protein
LELLEHERFDFAVVDLLLPDMRGSQILQKLKEKQIPAAAMSGVHKNDRFSKDAMLVYGAKAFFEKPFDIAKMFQLIRDTVGQDTPAHPLPAYRPGEEDDLGDLHVDEEVLDLVELEPAPDPELAFDFDEPSEQENEALEDLSEIVDEPPENKEEITLELPPGAIPKTEESSPAPAIGRKGRALPDWARSGELAATSLARLLTTYHRLKASGTLELKKDAALKRFSVSAGRLVSAGSNVAPERFARFCVQKGIITESHLNEAGLATGNTTPAQLVGKGLLTVDQSSTLVTEHAEALLVSAFAWSSGSYDFSEAAEEPPVGPVRSHLGPLILRGVLQAETLVSVRKRMPTERKLFPVAEPPFALHELKLTADQARLLISTDGTKTIDDLLQLSDLNERDTLAALFAYEAMGLVEERKETTRSKRESFGL